MDIGVIVAGILAVTLQDYISPAGIAVFSILSGLLSGFLYGAFYERWVRQAYLRWAHDLYAVPARFRVCSNYAEMSFGARPGNIEVAFPWADGVSVNRTYG